MEKIASRWAKPHASRTPASGADHPALVGDPMVVSAPQRAPVSRVAAEEIWKSIFSSTRVAQISKEQAKRRVTLVTDWIYELVRRSRGELARRRHTSRPCEVEPLGCVKLSDPWRPGLTRVKASKDVGVAVESSTGGTRAAF